MALSPDSTRLAVIDQAGDADLVTFDETGRHHVTGLGRLFGDEPPQWSPDGRFVLVSTFPKPILVRMSDGSRLELPLERAQVDWWPARGASHLFVLQGGSNEYSVAAFDLATNDLDVLGAVVTPDSGGADAGRLALTRPRVSPEGTEVLLGVPHGPHADYIASYPVRHRAGILSLASLSVRPIVAPFVDEGQWIARDHRHWYWTESWPADLAAGGHHRA